MVLTAGCGNQGPELAALRTEKLATVAPTGGSLVLETETDDHTSLGKPIKAQVYRVFAFHDHDKAIAARELFKRTALDSGWEIAPASESRFDLVYGSKNLGTGAAMLTIATYEYGGVNRVSILLEHRACPAAMCR